MKVFNEMKHYMLLIIIGGLIGVLAFTLEGSEFNDITQIEIYGNNHLSAERYLSFARLVETEGQEITANVIRDRLSKHPYINSVDVIKEERGLIRVEMNEKKIDAVLLKNSKQYLITDHGQIIPFIFSTKNIDVPIIISKMKDDDIMVFSNASKSEKLYSALKIISTAEIYDPLLHKSISEINLLDNAVSVQLMDLSSPVYFGSEDEIEKTVYLSKIFKHMKLNKFDEYLKYVDLRFNELVYLGFDDQFTNDGKNI